MTAPSLSLAAWEDAMKVDLEQGSWVDFADAVCRYSQEYPADPLGLGRLISGHFRAAEVTAHWLTTHPAQGEDL